MVQHTDTHMGTHTHMGEARVLAHMRMGQPVHIWAAYTHTGGPYTYRLPVSVRAAHTHMGLPICIWIACTRAGRIPVWDGT